MPIPERQLETWAKQGSTSQSRDTYASVRTTLQDPNSPYFLKNFDIRLQGSYANDTNVFRDSDVDVVIRLDSTFYHDAETLPADQYQTFQRMHPGAATYGYNEFKIQVTDWLRQRYGNTVRLGKKAIFIPGNESRRDCDVLPCVRFKYYYKYTATEDNFADGICFFLPDGTRVVNFPVQHIQNCTVKHQATSQWFKPTVRMYKNMRNYLVDHGVLEDGIAPSYFIEGMLWNVPDAKFVRTFEDIFVATFNYIVEADRSEFRCANGIHALLGSSSVSWPAENCDKFIAAIRRLWNGWQ